jgi:hypothetical protein
MAAHFIALEKPAASERRRRPAQNHEMPTWIPSEREAQQDGLELASELAKSFREELKKASVRRKVKK